MASKSKKNIVYSTNPDFHFEDEEELIETLPPEKQKLEIRLDKKQRKGKKVTLITGFVGNEEDLKQLGKKLKANCGAGGSVKHNEIIIQGDFRSQVSAILTDAGYHCKVLN